MSSTSSSSDSIAPEPPRSRVNHDDSPENLKDNSYTANRFKITGQTSDLLPHLANKIRTPPFPKSQRRMPFFSNPDPKRFSPTKIPPKLSLQFRCFPFASHCFPLFLIVLGFGCEKLRAWPELSELQCNPNSISGLRGGWEAWRQAPTATAKDTCSIV